MSDSSSVPMDSMAFSISYPDTISGPAMFVVAVFYYLRYAGVKLRLGGQMAQLFLFGIFVAVLFAYFHGRYFHRDDLFTRVIVFFLAAFGIIEGFGAFNALYLWSYSYYAFLEAFPLPDPVILICTDKFNVQRAVFIEAYGPLWLSLIAFTAQSFYLRRMYLFTRGQPVTMPLGGGKRVVLNIPIVLFTFVVMLFALASGIGHSAINIVWRGSFETYATNAHLHKWHTDFGYMWLSASAFVDIWISGILAYQLTKSKSGFAATDSVVSKAIRTVLETGILTSTIVFISLVLQCVASKESGHAASYALFPITANTGKIYTLCVFYTIFVRTNFKKEFERTNAKSGGISTTRGSSTMFTNRLTSLFGKNKQAKSSAVPTQSFNETEVEAKPETQINDVETREESHAIDSKTMA